MSHRHPDPCDPGESYAMPSKACQRCKAQCCIDCGVSAPGGLLCYYCRDWLRMTPAERAAE